MGTRADFYVGRGPDAEWLGSIALDGYPDGLPEHLLRMDNEPNFREGVEHFFNTRDDASVPVDGWPWPWDDSRTTDYSYAFDEGRVWASCFGHAWFDPREDEPEIEEGTAKVAVFPNMKDRAAVTFGKRSGLIVLGM